MPYLCYLGVDFGDYRTSADFATHLEDFPFDIGLWVDNMFITYSFTL